MTFRTEIATFGAGIAPFRNNQADQNNFQQIDVTLAVFFKKRAKKISVLHYFSSGLPYCTAPKSPAEVACIRVSNQSPR